MMQRYFFNIYNGKTQIDDKGLEFAAPLEARRQAMRLGSRLIEREASGQPNGRDWAIEVIDSTGLLQFRLDFTVPLRPKRLSVPSSDILEPGGS